MRYLFKDSKTTIECTNSDGLFVYYIFPKNSTYLLKGSNKVVTRVQTDIDQKVFTLYQGSTGLVMHVQNFIDRI